MHQQRIYLSKGVIMSKRFNKLSLALLALITLPLSACSLFNLASLEDRVVTAYSFVDNPQSGMDIEEYKLDNYPFKVNYGEQHLLYMSLQAYSELLRKYLNEDYYYYYTEDGNSSTWGICDYEHGEFYFLASVMPRQKNIYVGGSTSDVLNVGKDYSNSSLNVQMGIDGKTLREGTKDGYSYYGNTSYKAYRRNGEIYYPLSLLDAAIAPITGVYHIYNYNRIIQFNDYSQLTDIEYIFDNQKLTAFSEMKKCRELNFTSMPNYLIQDRANAFFFIMDNYYGLAQTRKIGSMVRYYEQQSYYDYFYTSDDSLRNEALYAAIGLLDDGHTAMDESEKAPWYTGIYSYGGSHLSNMLKVRSALRTSRGSFYSDLNKEVGDVIYSSSGKLAFFSFDSFNFADEAYKEDGETLKDDLYLSDTYFLFIKNFNDIISHGGVETVLIDVSINGGGVLGIMMKLLALLSKDNKAPIYVMEDSTMMVEKDIVSVDSNGDNEFTVADCYGNKLKFALLTSEFSYSCGNAFPYYAQKFNYATIVGQVSGGGECTVSEAMLPSGEHFYHSSTMHLGYFNEETRIWEGDENGAPVDHLIDYDHFYNLDYLDQLLN